MTRSFITGSALCLKSRHGALQLCARLALTLPLLPLFASAQESVPPRAGHAQASVPTLELNAPAAGEIGPGETHVYRISLAADQFARVIVQQRGVDVALSLRSDAGLLVATADDVESPNGSEVLTVVTEATGSFTLEVHADANSETRGQYGVRLAEVRAASPQDRERVLAQRLIAKGNRLLAQRTAASRLGAIEQYKEAALAFRRAGDRNREAGAMNNIGLFYFWLGEIQEAFEHGERALSIWREIKDQRGEARALNLLGQVHASSGEAGKALDAHRRALEIRRALEDPLGVIASLDQIGMVYASFGDARRALEYYEQALALALKSGQRRREARLMANLGDAHETLGSLDDALEYQTRALAGLRSRNNRGGVANALHSIGRIHVKRGDFSKARTSFAEALALQRELGNVYRVAESLTSIGEIHFRLGDSTKALEYFHESLALRRPGAQAAGEAVARYWVARVLSARGQTSDALSNVMRAVEISEKLRTSVASQELRASFFATVQQYYELYADLLMRRHAEDPTGGHDAAALAVSERARARSLLDLLAEARADIRRGVDPKLLAHERALQRRLNAAAENYAALSGSPREEAQAAVVAKEVATLEAQVDEARTEIRRVSPRYSALVQPRTLGLAEIKQLLDDNTLLVEYKLGESRSFLWAVTRDEMKSFVLPGRAQVEDAARRFHELLTERNRRIAGETPGQRRARLVRAEKECADVARVLSRMLLAPVAPMLRHKRLVVIADGALHYVPFAALPTPVSEPTDGANRDSSSEPRQPAYTRYLIVDHEVVNLPSASVLLALRKDLEGRRQAPRSVAVLADPVFDRMDRRVTGRAASSKNARPKTDPQATPKTSAPGDFTQAALDSGLTSGPSIPRLPFSRREASAILASATDGRGTAALDFRASRVTATSPELSQFRHIHFATHGLLDSTHPQLSGIVLSLVDESGHTQDGYLRLHEIYNLDLPAELVVLSACQTGLGKEIKGEGLVGLARGFMYAGSPRVAASLWRVDDAATADLMAAFYRGMLKEGLPPSAALRRAQIEILAQKQRQSPYYWAAFVLQGEWK